VTNIPHHIQVANPNASPQTLQQLAFGPPVPQDVASPPLQSTGNFGAIAYDPATGAYGWSWSCADQTMAEQAALSRAPGGKVICWGCYKYLAFATGPTGAWGCGWSRYKRIAIKDALKLCKVNDRNCSLVLVFDTYEGRNLA
jgi:hypothetical protein